MAVEDEQAEIEQAFIASWDGIERFNRNSVTHLQGEWVTPLLSLIAELRKRGYDRQFHAGQQMSSFFLSRSRLHGLRRGQPRIVFNLDDAGGMMVSEVGEMNVQLNLEHVEITPEVEEMLKRLVAQPIN